LPPTPSTPPDVVPSGSVASTRHTELAPLARGASSRKHGALRAALFLGLAGSAIAVLILCLLYRDRGRSLQSVDPVATNPNTVEYEGKPAAQVDASTMSSLIQLGPNSVLRAYRSAESPVVFTATMATTALNLGYDKESDGTTWARIGVSVWVASGVDEGEPIEANNGLLVVDDPLKARIAPILEVAPSGVLGHGLKIEPTQVVTDSDGTEWRQVIVVGFLEDK